MIDDDPRAMPDAPDPDPDGAGPLQPEQDIPESVLDAVARVLESLAAWEQEERGHDTAFLGNDELAGRRDSHGPDQ